MKSREWKQKKCFVVEPFEEKLWKALNKYQNYKQRTMKKNQVYRSAKTNVENLNLTELPVDRFHRLAQEMSYNT